MTSLQELSPKDDRQRALQAREHWNMGGVSIQTRWLMYEPGTNSVSVPHARNLDFLAGCDLHRFGLFAPRNATVITALFVAGGAVSGAIFLILEMYAPFGGLIKLSSAPLRTVTYTSRPVTVGVRTHCNSLLTQRTSLAGSACLSHAIRGNRRLRNGVRAPAVCDDQVGFDPPVWRQKPGQ